MKKRVNKVISILLSVAMLFAMLPSFSGLMASAENLSGEGTVTSGRWDDQEGGKYKYADTSPFVDNEGKLKSGDTYTITDDKQLAGLMVLVNEGKIFDGKTINLSADEINLSAHEWVPIGKDSGCPFKATVQGNPATNAVTKITGMKIGKEGEGNARDYQYAGLIGNYEGPEISNIGIGAGSAVYISGDSGAFVGGIVGWALNSITISNCYNKGAITVKITKHNTAVGGIVGWAECASITIRNCYNTGAISSVTANPHPVNAGGIVGFARGVEISNCYNTGAISSEDYAGGIVGYANAYNNGSGSITQEISNCYNTGAISSVTANPHPVNAGGIVGRAHANNYSTGSITQEISNCYNTGAISATATSAYAGGIAGDVSFYNKSTGSIIQTISNCYNTGEISGTYRGGILGFDNGTATIENCYYIGADKGCSNKADGDNLKNILKEGEQNFTQGYTTTLTNGVPTETIANTSANVNLKGADKLGAGFKMVYYFELSDGTEKAANVGDDGNLTFPSDTTGTAKLRGIEITQNKLIENGYTGEPETKAFPIFDGYITYELNGGNWKSEDSVPIAYETGKGLTLPTATDIQKTGYTFEGWYYNEECTGTAVTEIPANDTGDKTFYAKYTLNQYKVNVDSAVGGKVTTSTTNPYYGNTVTLTVTPNAGYQLKTLTVDGKNVKDQVNDNKYTFKMPANDVTVTAEFEVASGYREIKVDPNTENVTVTPDKTAAKPGEKVTATVEPEDGYEVDKIYVNGEEIPLGADHKFSFTVPEDGEVVITVTMQELNSWVRDPINCEASGTPRWYYYKDSEKLSGWQEVQADGETGQTKRYYFNPERGNSAHTGWMQDETGSWYYFAVNNYRDNTPLKSPAEGLAAMWTGWANDGGPEWYYLDATTGKMHTGWTQDGGSEWYYLDATDGDIKLGWQFISGKWYYFTDDKSENMRHYGQMQTGWQFIGGDWYYFYADGSMAANTLIDSYHVDENGRWIA